MNKKIAVIGGGNLGTSIVNGLITSKILPACNITITKRNTQSLQHFINQGVNVSDDNVLAVKNSDIIILAIKPYTIEEVGQIIKPFVGNKIVISLATGVSIEKLRLDFGNQADYFRVMPNTATSVGFSMTCIAHESTEKEKVLLIKKIFDALGSTIIIEEDLMAAATVLGACGIAFALRFIRAMIQGGIQIGFDSATASLIANQTVRGATELLFKHKKHPEEEIDRVTTPKGCTIAGLNEMEHLGFSSSLIKGILTSYGQIQQND